MIYAYAGGRGAVAAVVALIVTILLPVPMWCQQGWIGTGPVYTNSNVGIGTSTPTRNYDANTPHTVVTQIKGALALGGDSQGGNEDGLIQLGSFNFVSGNNWNGYGTFGTNLAAKSEGNVDAFYTPVTHLNLGYAGMVTSHDGIRFFAEGPVATKRGATITPVSRLTITTAGNVGIGTSSPQYKLAVSGTIGAQEVIVTSAGWSDYVFRPGYRLRSLSEIGEFITANGHLPDIPTEAEVQENGISVGDMQAKLLAKIEELTLHMVQQEKENRELRESLANESRKLHERLARLEDSGTIIPAPSVAK